MVNYKLAYFKITVQHKEFLFLRFDQFLVGKLIVITWSKFLVSQVVVTCFFFLFQKLIQSMSSKEVELQRLNNGKVLLEKRLDEMLKQKEQEQAVSPELIF